MAARFGPRTLRLRLSIDLEPFRRAFRAVVEALRPAMDRIREAMASPAIRELVASFATVSQVRPGDTLSLSAAGDLRDDWLDGGGDHGWDPDDEVDPYWQAAAHRMT